MQEQAGLPDIIWHKEFGPQGDGMQDGGRSVIGKSVVTEK